jgi:hypothetical protein
MLNKNTGDLLKRSGAHITTENLMSNSVQHRQFVEMYEANVEALIASIIDECATAAEESARSFSDGAAATGSSAAAWAVRCVLNKYIND